MPEPRHFLGRLRGRRSTWPHDMTEAEERVMAEHFQYLSKLVDAGVVLVAGPCFEDPPFGLVLLRAEDKAAALAILEADPSVRAGLHDPEISEMRLSLWSERSKA